MIYKFGTDVGQQNSSSIDTGHGTFRTSVEQEHNALTIHADESNDLKQARDRADEIINISGAEVKVFTRTDNEDYDHVWDSDADPTYWAAQYMKAFFKPAPLESELKRWGAEIVNKTEVVFSLRQLFQKFNNRLLRPGDVIQLPYNATSLSPKNYRILNASPTGNYRYHWLYMTCICETLTADITVRPENDMPMIQEDDKGTYYEGM